MPAVMAKYNPFAEKAGMRKIMKQPPQEDALKIGMVLEKLGFSIQLLGSENYNLEKLQSLKTDDVESVSDHQRLIEEIIQKIEVGGRNFREIVDLVFLEPFF